MSLAYTTLFYSIGNNFSTYTLMTKLEQNTQVGPMTDEAKSLPWELKRGRMDG